MGFEFLFRGGRGGWKQRQGEGWVVISSYVQYTYYTMSIPGTVFTETPHGRHHACVTLPMRSQSHVSYDNPTKTLAKPYDTAAF